MEKEAELCKVFVEGERVFLTKYVRSIERDPRDRGYEPSNRDSDSIECPVDPKAIGEAIFHLMGIGQPHVD